VVAETKDDDKSVENVGGEEVVAVDDKSGEKADDKSEDKKADDKDEDKKADDKSEDKKDDDNIEDLKADEKSEDKMIKGDGKTVVVTEGSFDESAIRGGRLVATSRWSKPVVVEKRMF
jgi:hypothetical protein